MPPSASDRTESSDAGGGPKQVQRGRLAAKIKLEAKSAFEQAKTKGVFKEREDLGVVTSGHLDPELFHPETRARIIHSIVSDLRAIREQEPFDAIAFNGISGALVAPSVADALDVSLIAVRDPSAVSQSQQHREREGVEGVQYIILDDHETSGDTVRMIVSAIGDSSDWVGTFLYGRRVWVSER